MRCSISIAEKGLSVGSSATRPSYQQRRQESLGLGGLDLYKWKDKSHFLCFLQPCLSFFPLQLMVFPVPCFNLSFIQTMTDWKKRPFRGHQSLSWFITGRICHPSSLKSLLSPYFSPFHTLPTPPPATRHWFKSFKGQDPWATLNKPMLPTLP